MLYFIIIIVAIILALEKTLKKFEMRFVNNKSQVDTHIVETGSIGMAHPIPKNFQLEMGFDPNKEHVQFEKWAWEKLSEDGRTFIIYHELGHIMKGDIWRAGMIEHEYAADIYAANITKDPLKCFDEFVEIGQWGYQNLCSGAYEYYIPEYEKIMEKRRKNLQTFLNNRKKYTIPGSVLKRLFLRVVQKIIMKIVFREF